MSICDRNVDYYHSCQFDTASIAPLSQEYDCLHDLSNEAVWPHCPEGEVMGVDGDELLQEFIDEGRVGRTEDGTYFLLLSADQIWKRVLAKYHENRSN